MKKSYNIGIIVLLVAVIFAGYFLFKKPAPENKISESSAPEENTGSLDESEESEEVSENQGLVSILIAKDTKIFRLDTDNLYADEDPSTIVTAPEIIPSEDSSMPEFGEPYEIYGEVFDIGNVTNGEQKLRIIQHSSITEATSFPRSTEISLEDIKIGDWIVASNRVGVGGIYDFQNTDFIMVLPPLGTAPESQ